MNDKEKEQIALEIYQQLIAALEEVSDIPAVVSIVNNLIEENGLSPEKENIIPLETKSKYAISDNLARVCPKCGSTNVAKNGSAYGKRRFHCKDCNAYFCTSSGKLTQGSSTSQKTWSIFIEGMLCDDSLPMLADKCNISLSTAHNWRMKLFSQVSNSVEGKILKGIIQEDEFYLSSSFKGNWKSTLNLGIEKDYSEIVPDYQKYGFRDYPHKRGSQDSQRGLSKDKICIATAVDDSKSIIGKPIGRENVNSKDLSYAFTGKMDQSSIIAIDKSKGGIKFAQDSGLAHFALDAKKESRKGTYNLQLVNSLHSVIASKTHSRACFATKNAEAYITWEAWKLVNRKKSIDEKKNILKTLLIPGKKTTTNKEIRHNELPSILHPES
ncbi:MAG: IS1595 family transposase, partial [Spirochaetaceae bacterium]|nr:IS1595 family transposase [Spirochaetaceae bacterium]